MPTRDDIIDLIHKTIEAYIDDVDGVAGVDIADLDMIDLSENIMITLINKHIITGVS